MDIRVSAIEFEPTQAAKSILEDNVFTSIQRLEEVIDKPAERRLFIAETLLNSPSFFQFRTLLHKKLGIPEAVFERHRWSHTTCQFNETINCPRLPSLTRPGRLFSLEYFELWQVSHTVLNSYGPITVKCATTDREIQCYKWGSPARGWLLITPRKCTFWSKKTANGWPGK